MLLVQPGERGVTDGGRKPGRVRVPHPGDSEKVYTRALPHHYTFPGGLHVTVM